MKSIILFLTILIASFSPVAETVYIGQQKDLADSNVHEIQLANVIGSPSQMVYVRTLPTNTGTIEITVQRSGNTTMPSGLYEFPAGVNYPFTIVNGTYNLYVRASGATQSFVISQ